MSTQHTDTEPVVSDNYFEPTMYRISYRCEKCGHTWIRTLKAVPKKDPPCPSAKCEERSRVQQLERENANLQRMLQDGAGPAHIGHKNVVKAVDATANMVMQDYGMTDLRDNLRPGDTMAPKLPGPQQAMADNYFGGQKTKGVNLMDGRAIEITKKQTDLLGRRAIAGAFRGMAVPPSIVTPHARAGDSPLVRVGTEQLQGQKK